MNENAAYRIWLTNLDSEHTRRAYRRAIDDLVAFTGKELDRTTFADAQGFAAYMREQDLSKATINVRLAACSSYFSFVMQRYAPGSLAHNPFSAVKRAKVQRFGKSRALSAEQARALLAQPDRATERGSRDYALLLFAVLTGRRSSEIVRLVWQDVSSVDTYHWRGKGGKERTDPLPKPVWMAIKLYLQQKERWELMKDWDPVFTGVSHWVSLSTTWLNSIVQDHARAAGLPEWVTTHTLRHTAARLRIESGSSVLDLSTQLAHADLRTTQIYVSSIAHKDKHADAVYASLTSSKEDTQIP